jgi:FKBP-type peptidyl-prolyl cis-trans isomerase FkpA
MLKRFSRPAALAAILATGMACNSAESPTTPIVFVGPANLVISDVRAGTGATFTLGQEATVHYGLWLYDPTGIDNKGTFIEDSRLSGLGAPFATRMAAGTIIEGWRQGVPGMRVGGQRRLIIPPSLAFGPQGNGPIPPNAWVVFDVDLLSIKD